MTRTRFRSRLWLAIGTLGVCGSLLAASDQVRIIPAEELKLWWHADPGSPNRPAPYPVEALKSGVEGCMAVAFEIENDGNVSNERIWLDKVPRFTYRKAMEQSALLGVHQWHFVPSPDNAKREAVYTYHILTYTLTGSSTKWTSYDQRREDKLKSECELPDFPQQVQAMIAAKQKQTGVHP